MVSTAWVDTSVKILKLLAYIVVFAAVLGSAVISKGTLLFITSQLKKDKQIPHCNKGLGTFKHTCLLSANMLLFLLLAYYSIEGYNVKGLKGHFGKNYFLLNLYKVF
jgi:hypothetical protein